MTSISPMMFWLNSANSSAEAWIKASSFGPTGRYKVIVSIPKPATFPDKVRAESALRQPNDLRHRKFSR